MRQQDFNIIFQPSKDATSGFVIIKKCRFKSRSYGTYIYICFSIGICELYNVYVSSYPHFIGAYNYRELSLTFEGHSLYLHVGWHPGHTC